jgi:hypothetical protein
LFIINYYRVHHNRLLQAYEVHVRSLVISLDTTLPNTYLPALLKLRQYYATKHEIGLSSATTSSNTVAAGAIIDSILLDAASL